MVGAGLNPRWCPELAMLGVAGCASTHQQGIGAVYLSATIRDGHLEVTSQVGPRVHCSAVCEVSPVAETTIEV